jgi:hypothetical protein
VTDLCPEGEYRAGLSDAEFWDHVAANLLPGSVILEPGTDDDPPDPPALDVDRPCPECGERGACGYDAEGRPMVHVVVEGES